MNRASRILAMVLTGELASLYYSAWTRLKRLDLSKSTVEDLGLPSAIAYHYGDSGGPLLAKVLRSLEIPHGSRILDLGSGKGGAVFTMAMLPFAEVHGVEISQRLVDVAITNKQRISQKGNIAFTCCDAAEFTDLDRFNFVYIFNPFPAKVYKQVQQNLIASLDRTPRPLTVICKHPEGSLYEHFPETPRFTLKKKLEFQFSHPFYVFASSKCLALWGLLRMAIDDLEIPELMSLMS